MFEWLAFIAVMAFLSDREHQARPVVRRLYVESSGHPIDEVRLFHIDLIRAMRQRPLWNLELTQDTDYADLSQIDALRDRLEARGGPGIYHHIEYNEVDQVMDIWVPTPLSPSHRPDAKSWKALWQRWGAFVDPDVAALFPAGEVSLPEGQRKIPTYNKKPRFYVASHQMGQMGSFADVHGARQGIIGAPKHVRDNVAGIVEVGPDGAIWHAYVPSRHPLPVNFEAFPDDLRLFNVLMEQYDAVGMPIDVQWAYAKAREMNVPAEAVSKVMAIQRRVLGWYG